MSLAPHASGRSSPDSAETVRFRLEPYIPYLVAVVLLAVYGTWSINRHVRLRTGGYDFGIFEQAIRGYAGLGAPISTLKAPAFNLLGDHFHPILAVVAPFYRLFPSPFTILIFQAALIAVSAIPVTRLAMSKVGSAGGVAVGVAYGLSWGIQSAIDFDFHEVAFAVPMLAFSLVAIVEQRWRAAALWALPLVLVKEDLPVTLAAIGFVMAIRGSRRLGLAVIGFAVASGLAIVMLLIPAFSPTGAYSYSITQVPSSQGPFERMFTPLAKWRTLAWLAIPTVLLAPLSSLLIVAVPTLVWRFWSTNPLYWGMGFQYSAVLMPIVFVAFIEAVTKVRFLQRGVRRKQVVSFVAAGCAVIGTFTYPWPLAGLVKERNWQVSQSVRETKELISRIPDGSSVAADNHLAAQLTARCTVYLFPGYPGHRVDPDWVIYSVPFDTSMAAEVSIVAELADIRDRYTVVAENPSAVLLRRS